MTKSNEAEPATRALGGSRLTCVPQSLLSGDYEVTGASAGEGTVTFGLFTEEGGISLGRSEFAIRKHGWLSGKWSLEAGGKTYADAYKPSGLFRLFEVRSGEMLLTVKAQSAIARSFELVCQGATVGGIHPAHPFTRRSRIECSSSVPEVVLLFAFWLAALTWRRASQSI
jgi:hypothetical protein